MDPKEEQVKLSVESMPQKLVTDCNTLDDSSNEHDISTRAMEERLHVLCPIDSTQADRNTGPDEHLEHDEDTKRSFRHNISSQVVEGMIFTVAPSGDPSTAQEHLYRIQDGRQLSMPYTSSNTERIVEVGNRSIPPDVREVNDIFRVIEQGDVLEDDGSDFEPDDPDWLPGQAEEGPLEEVVTEDEEDLETDDDEDDDDDDSDDDDDDDAYDDDDGSDDAESGESSSEADDESEFPGEDGDWSDSDWLTLEEYDVEEESHSGKENCDGSVSCQESFQFKGSFLKRHDEFKVGIGDNCEETGEVQDNAIDEVSHATEECTRRSFWISPLNKGPNTSDDDTEGTEEHTTSKNLEEITYQGDHKMEKCGQAAGYEEDTEEILVITKISNLLENSDNEMCCRKNKNRPVHSSRLSEVSSTTNIPMLCCKVVELSNKDTEESSGVDVSCEPQVELLYKRDTRFSRENESDCETNRESQCGVSKDYDEQTCEFNGKSKSLQHYDSIGSVSDYFQDSDLKHLENRCKQFNPKDEQNGGCGIDETAAINGPCFLSQEENIHQGNNDCRKCPIEQEDVKVVTSHSEVKEEYRNNCSDCDNEGDSENVKKSVPENVNSDSDKNGYWSRWSDSNNDGHKSCVHEATKNGEQLYSDVSVPSNKWSGTEEDDETLCLNMLPVAKNSLVKNKKYGTDYESTDQRNKSYNMDANATGKHLSESNNAYADSWLKNDKVRQVNEVFEETDKSFRNVRQNDSRKWEKCYTQNENGRNKYGNRPTENQGRHGQNTTVSRQKPSSKSSSRSSEIYGEESQRGVGVESEDEVQNLDDDEDRTKPQYIPRKGSFYQHDDRSSNSSSNQRKTFQRSGTAKKLWKDDGRWKHDRYIESKQAPKSREEIIATYGYDIRRETERIFNESCEKRNKQRVTFDRENDFNFDKIGHQGIAKCRDEFKTRHNQACVMRQRNDIWSDSGKQGRRSRCEERKYMDGRYNDTTERSSSVPVYKSRIFRGKLSASVVKCRNIQSSEVEAISSEWTSEKCPCTLSAVHVTTSRDDRFSNLEKNHQSSQLNQNANTIQKEETDEFNWPETPRGSYISLSSITESEEHQRLTSTSHESIFSNSTSRLRRSEPVMKINVSNELGTDEFNLSKSLLPGVYQSPSLINSEKLCVTSAFTQERVLGLSSDPQSIQAAWKAKCMAREHNLNCTNPPSMSRPDVLLTSWIHANRPKMGLGSAFCNAGQSMQVYEQEEAKKSRKWIGPLKSIVNSSDLSPNENESSTFEQLGSDLVQSNVDCAAASLEKEAICRNGSLRKVSDWRSQTVHSTSAALSNHLTEEGPLRSSDDFEPPKRYSALRTEGKKPSRWIGTRKNHRDIFNSLKIGIREGFPSTVTKSVINATDSMDNAKINQCSPTVVSGIGRSRSSYKSVSKNRYSVVRQYPVAKEQNQYLSILEVPYHALETDPTVSAFPYFEIPEATSVPIPCVPYYVQNPDPI